LNSRVTCGARGEARGETRGEAPSGFADGDGRDAAPPDPPPPATPREA